MNEKELVVNYCPHSAQKPFHESKAKFRLFSGGVGSGKTSAGVNELINMAVNSESGCVLAMLAPTYSMLSRVTIPEFFKFCPKQIIKHYHQTKQEITLTNGVKIMGLAGDTESHIDRLRGLSLGSAFGDEVALCPEYLHDIIIARLRDSRGPLSVIYTTTPKGFNWLYRIFFEKKNSKGTSFKKPDDYALFGASTWDNPYTPDDYKNSLSDKYHGRFASQELEGKFVKFEGLVYPNFDIRTHIVRKVPETFKAVFGGADWGFRHASCILFMGLDEDGRVWVLDEVFEKNMLIEELIESVKRKNNTYKAGMFYADSARPEYVMAFNNHELGCVGANKDVVTGISEVTARLKVQADGLPRLFVHERCVNLIREFGMYRYKDSKDDKPFKDEPVKLDDDCLDSLRYAVMSLFQSDERGKPESFFSYG